MILCELLPNLLLIIDCKTVRIFGVLKYARVVNQKVWNEAENGEGDWERHLTLRLTCPSGV